MNRYCALLLIACLPVTQTRADIVTGEEAFLEGDYESAYSDLLQIGLDNLLAAYYLGVISLDRLRPSANPERGIRWLTYAALRGHAGAQLRLAIAYEDGDGVDQDYLAAAEWMLDAAQGGNADAQYYLGQYYRNGQGVVQDDAQAYEWIHRSVEYDISHDRLLDALLYLGAACEWGRGVPQDLIESYKWLSLASSFSTNDARMHDEASRALGALRTRMNGVQLADAAHRAEEWWAEKQKMYGRYFAGTASDRARWRAGP